MEDRWAVWSLNRKRPSKAQTRTPPRDSTGLGPDPDSPGALRFYASVCTRVLDGAVTRLDGGHTLTRREASQWLRKHGLTPTISPQKTTVSREMVRTYQPGAVEMMVR